MPAPRLGLVGAGASNALYQLLAQEEAKRAMAAQEQYERAFAGRKQNEVERSNVAGEGIDTRRVDISQNADTRAGSLFTEQQGDRANARNVLKLLDPSVRDAGILRMGGVSFDPNDLRSPEQLGQREGVTTAAAWNNGGRSMFTDRTGIEGAEQRRINAARPQTPNFVWRRNPDGTETRVPDTGGVTSAPAQRPTTITGEQRKTRDYYGRMREALDNMNAVEDDLSDSDIAIIQNAPGWTPDVLKNLTLSTAGQKYAQAMRAYTLAKLRSESGAAISAGEFAKEALTVGRSVGDAPDVLDQKRRTREGVAEGFAATSGPAYEEYYGKPFAPAGRAGASEKTLTEADIQSSMRANGWTREQALAEAKSRGFTVR